MANIDIVKRHPLLFTLPVITLIIVSSLYIVNVNNEPSGITAMDGREIADEIALNWSENNSLESVRPAGIIIEDGCFDAWKYIYSVNINTTMKISLEVNVYENGTYTTKKLGPVQINYYEPISNWTIDSDEAYNIIMLNETIASSMNNNPRLYDIILMSGTETPVWFIELESDQVNDNPIRAVTQVDANTGEVLYVRVDN